MNDQVNIGTFTIERNGRPFVVAEAGVNHNGDLALVMKMVLAAANANVDAIKFQTFLAEDLVTKEAELAPYQKKNLQDKLTQQGMLRRLELKEQWYPRIIAECRKKNIAFLSTPHGSFAMVDLLTRLNVPAFKIASPDLTNLPFLDYVARQGRPILLSTGMATEEEIAEAVAIITTTGNTNVVVLHCTTSYPCPLNEVNLRAMQTLMRIYPLVGYSDHTEGIEVAVWAALLGAVVIEKHFTLDRSLPGPDQASSLEPDEVKTLMEKLTQLSQHSTQERVELIQQIPRVVMGHARKKPTSSERKIARTIRKSLVWNQSLGEGHAITLPEDVAIKRPGNGLPPKAYASLAGKILTRNVNADALIKAGDFA